ncbi:hypothetical protein OROGR_031684 [Orobanche gracilis]
MEFWGVEVKAGEPLYVAPEDGKLIHLSQVALGEFKNVKSANSVLVHMTVDDKRVVIGRLSAERSQIKFDLVLQKKFMLSHDSIDGSVYFCGYTLDDDGMAKRKQKDSKKQELIMATEKSTLRRCSGGHQSRSIDEEDATLDQPVKKVRGASTYGKCDDESKESVKNFNHEEFDNFCKSFNSEVVKSVGGTMGNLYKATYRGVVRVTVVDFDQHTESQGNAFVICKKKRVCVLLTCAHIFSGLEASKSIYVVSSDFKCFKAEVWHISENIGVCLLIVKDDLGSNVVELETLCDDVHFNEDIFSISCPVYKMNVKKSLFSPSNYEKDFVHTLWFTLTRGYVSHPFLEGIHPRNLDGIFLQIRGGNWGEGSSGAPVLSMEGKAIGIYVGSNSESDALNIKYWALPLNSVRDYLEKIFNVPEERKGSSSLKSMLWSCLKDLKAKRRGRKGGKESTFHRCSAEQQSGCASGEDSLDQSVKKVRGPGPLIRMRTDGIKPKLGIKPWRIGMLSKSGGKLTRRPPKMNLGGLRSKCDGPRRSKLMMASRDTNKPWSLKWCGVYRSKTKAET